MRKTISIRVSLLTSMLIVVGLLSASIVLTTTWGVRRAVRSLSRSIITHTTEQTKVELDGFFNPIENEIVVASLWAKKGLLDINNIEGLNNLFIPILESSPQISAAMLANSLGQGYLLLKTGDGWLVRETRAQEWGSKHRETELPLDPSLATTFKNREYVPQARPWYQGAIKTKKLLKPFQIKDESDLVHWTKPYIFFTSKEPGITASLAYDSSDGTEWVVGFDVLLSDISKFTMGLQVSKNGKVIVLSEEDSRVIGLPQDDRFLDPASWKDYLLKKLSELKVPALLSALKAHQGIHSGQSTLEVKSKGKAWWAGFRTYSLAKGRNLLITVVVPEADLLGNLRKMKYFIFAIIGAVLLLAVFNVILLSDRYSKPIKNLVTESDRIRRGDFDPGLPIVSEIEEFNSLALAQDHMRTGLKTLFKLERDIQIARQIQQDTFPKKLPQLKGYEIIAWNKPADETGGDSYDVIGVKRGPKDKSIELTESAASEAVFLLADATGHGIGPALSVTAVRSMLRMSVRTGLDGATILKNINGQLCSDLQKGRFITAWFGHLDVGKNSLLSFSAGQAPLFHFEYNSRQCNAYNIDMPPLGIMEEAQIKISQPIIMKPGDMFVVLSDGFIESADSAGNLFGEERVSQLIKEFCELSPQELLDKMLEEIKAFTADAPAADDRTAIIIKRKKV